jgi:hypothetical protein
VGGGFRRPDQEGQSVLLRGYGGFAIRVRDRNKLFFADTGVPELRALANSGERDQFLSASV